MRLTSIIWFAAFRQLETNRGAFVTAIRKGAQQAGAIFVIHNHLDGHASLYAPAPQALLEDDTSGRKFERVLQTKTMQEIEEYLEKQARFDPDLWIIETESGAGEPCLDL